MTINIQINILLSVLLGILFIVFNQLVVIYVISVLNNKIEETIKFLNKKYEEKKEYIKNANFAKEEATYYLIKDKKEILGFIPKIIGVAESVVFVLLPIILLLGFQFDFPNTLKLVGAIFISWFGLKFVGSYQNWSGAVLGRANYYTFLFGTLINIILAITEGLFISKLLIF